MPGKTHIFLSPHFDDAALSCGGHIAHLTAQGQPVIVATLFGGQPNRDSLSPFAQEIHARPLAGKDPIALRLEEDRQAMAVLGARRRLGDELDAIYRRDRERTRWLYGSEEAIFGAIDEEEGAFHVELAHDLATLAPAADKCILYAPLAIGHHVDHQLVRRAATSLQEAGYEVRFYEDCPYAWRNSQDLAAALADPGPEQWRSEVISFDEKILSLKIEAIQAYRSQVPVLFGDTSQVEPVISRFAGQRAGDSTSGRWAERYWRLTTGSGARSEVGDLADLAVGPESQSRMAQQQIAGQKALPAQEVGPTERLPESLWRRFLSWLRQLLG